MKEVHATPFISQQRRPEAPAAVFPSRKKPRSQQQSRGRAHGPGSSGTSPGDPAPRGRPLDRLWPPNSQCRLQSCRLPWERTPSRPSSLQAPCAAVTPAQRAPTATGRRRGPVPCPSAPPRVRAPAGSQSLPLPRCFRARTAQGFQVPVALGATGTHRPCRRHQRNRPGGAVPLLAPSACARAGLPSSQPSLRCHPVCPTVPSVLVQSRLFHCHSLLLSFWQHGNSLSRPSLALAFGTRRFLEAGFPRRLRHLLRPGEMFHPAAPSGDLPPGAAREEKWGPEGPDPGVSREDPCRPLPASGVPRHTFSADNSNLCSVPTEPSPHRALSPHLLLLQGHHPNSGMI